MSGAVPELRFPGFRSDWKKTTIGSCGSFYYGRSAPKWSVSEDAPTPCIRYGELYVRFGAKVDKIYSRTNIDPSKLKFSKGGEILVPRVGEDPKDFAQCTMLPFPGVAIGEMISVFETEEDSLFFTYYFNTMKNEFASMVAGGNPANLYYDNLKPLKIWRPSIEEQKKIASSLELVDVRLAALRGQAQALRQFKTGLMQKLFSQELRFTREDGSDFPDWEERKLVDISVINPAASKNPEAFLYIDLESVNGGCLKDPKPTKKKDAPSRAQRILEKGDVLFQLVRPYQRNNLLFEKDGDYVASTGYAQLRARQSRSFLFHLLHTEQFVRDVIERCTGTGYPAITSAEIGKIRVPVPCLEEQHRIGGAISALDAKIDAVTDQITHMETFKKGLLQKMFV